MSEMSLTDKLKELGRVSQKQESNQKVDEPLTVTFEEYEKLLKSIRPEDKVKLFFQQSAGKYWGKVEKVSVLHTRETEKGTKYYLVIASIVKNGEKQRLIQEWFIGKDETPKPAGGRNIVIPEDFVDEVSILITD